MFFMSTDPVRFCPREGEAETGAPVYFIRPASLKQRAAFNRALLAEGASYARDEEMRSVFRAGVEQMIDDRDQPAALNLVDRLDAGATLSTEENKAVAELERFIVVTYKPYSSLLAQRHFWLEMAPLLAAQMFLVGWENIDLPFEVKNGLVLEALLQALPMGDVNKIGMRALELSRPSEQQRKNSDSPSKSEETRTVTKAAPIRSTMAQAGKSTAKSTPKTPASRSPRKR
jgi:hypothetical protein